MNPHQDSRNRRGKSCLLHVPFYFLSLPKKTTQRSSRKSKIFASSSTKLDTAVPRVGIYRYVDSGKNSSFQNICQHFKIRNRNEQTSFRRNVNKQYRNPTLRLPHMEETALAVGRMQQILTCAFSFAETSYGGSPHNRSV